MKCAFVEFTLGVGTCARDHFSVIAQLRGTKAEVQKLGQGFSLISGF